MPGADDVTPDQVCGRIAPGRDQSDLTINQVETWYCEALLEVLSMVDVGKVLKAYCEKRDARPPHPVEFHNVYDFMAFAAEPVPGSWEPDRGPPETAWVSWWPGGEGEPAGVGLAVQEHPEGQPTKVQSTEFLPAEARTLAVHLQRAAFLAEEDDGLS